MDMTEGGNASKLSGTSVCQLSILWRVTRDVRNIRSDFSDTYSRNNTSLHITFHYSSSSVYPGGYWGHWEVHSGALEHYQVVQH